MNNRYINSFIFLLLIISLVVINFNQEEEPLVIEQDEEIVAIDTTITTSSISPALKPASFNAASHGLIVFSIKSSTNVSSLALVTLMFKCFGPDWSAVINGRLISV